MAPAKRANAQSGRAMASRNATDALQLGGAACLAARGENVDAPQNVASVRVSSREERRRQSRWSRASELPPRTVEQLLLSGRKLLLWANLLEEWELFGAAGWYENYYELRFLTILFHRSDARNHY